jgi:type I site-specific restriction endonuclease
MIAGKPFMKLMLIATIAALVAIPAVAYAQQGQANVPKPTKADVQNVVQIVTADKAKTQAYCDLTKLYDQVEAAEQKNDTNTIEALAKHANALVDKLGPEYSKMAEGLDQVDLTSSEGKELMSILLELDKLCTR